LNFTTEHEIVLLRELIGPDSSWS